MPCWIFFAVPLLCTALVHMYIQSSVDSRLLVILVCARYDAYKCRHPSSSEASTWPPSLCTIQNPFHCQHTEQRNATPQNLPFFLLLLFLLALILIFLFFLFPSSCSSSSLYRDISPRCNFLLSTLLISSPERVMRRSKNAQSEEKCTRRSHQKIAQSSSEFLTKNHEHVSSMFETNKL